MSITFTLNGVQRSVTVEEDTPLLWVIRDTLGLKGTKFGCGIAACGSCTVHIDGKAQRSCTYPISRVAGREVTTIEGLGSPERLHALQQAWIAEQVPQCGYCQSGMIMAAAALLQDNPQPTDAEIDQEMTNICRCGTYPRVRRAIHGVMSGKYQSEPVEGVERG